MPRPQLRDTYLGAQPKMSEFKLKVDSHVEANIKVSGDDSLKIKLKTEKPLKVTTRLIDATNDAEGTAIEGHVFMQRKNTKELRFVIGFPKDGFYKFEIFALDASSAEESLPNVYNYLIEVVNTHRPAMPFAKAYTKFFTDCCYMEKPLALSSDDDLENVMFEITVPDAQKVAVHSGEEWFHLELKSDIWVGRANLERCKKKSSKVTVNGNYDKNNDSYSVLLEYNI